MNTIRLGAVLAVLVSSGAFARASAARTDKVPNQILCTDGTVAAKAGRGACSHHGGIARPTQSAPTAGAASRALPPTESAPTDGAASRALPPTERAPDNAASKSPWSIFGGKRKEPAPAQSPAQSQPAQGRSAAPISRSPRQSDAQTTAQPTAKCRDGSASYSAHHSGACSHHGGVAQWLDAR